MWTREQIEFKARTLLSEIEKSAASIWPNTQPQRLFMCDPEAACKVLGLGYFPDQHLGQYGGTATAGMLDRARKSILISSKQTFEEMRFTAAHELGHWMLHPDQVMFRDRSPSTYRSEVRPVFEREADQFAATFLMPPRLVRAAFKARFPLKEPLINSNSVCYNLSMRDADYLQGLPPGSIQFARAVANADAFNGVRFDKSLARLFNVSVSAMAIRLQELGLVS